MMAGLCFVIPPSPHKLASNLLRDSKSRGGYNVRIINFQTNEFDKWFFHTLSCAAWAFNVVVWSSVQLVFPQTLGVCSGVGTALGSHYRFIFYFFFVLLFYSFDRRALCRAQLSVTRVEINAAGICWMTMHLGVDRVFPMDGIQLPNWILHRLLSFVM